MRIIHERREERGVNYARKFDYEGHDGWGFSFACDPDGTVHVQKGPAAENYRKCLAGEVDGRKVVDRGIVSWPWRDQYPAIGKCDCGANVELACFTNTCDRCGADYNSAGQLLAPRECWGEETGEHWTECV